MFLYYKRIATLWPDGGSEKGMQHSRGQLDRNTLARGEEQRAGQDIVGPRDIKKATKTADWAIRLPQTSNLEARLIWFFIIIKFWSSWSEFWYLIYLFNLIKIIIEYWEEYKYCFKLLNSKINRLSFIRSIVCPRKTFYLYWII